MASPACEVKNGAAAYVATTGGVNITPGATVIIRLASQADVDVWAISCLTTDEGSDPATVNASLVIDSALKTATFTAPAAGKAYRFQSKVGNVALGRDRNNVEQPSFTTTFVLYTTVDGERVHALDETTEGNTLAGWGADFNALVRRDRAQANAANFTTTLATATDTPFTVPIAANERLEIVFEGTAQCSGVGGSKYAIAAPSGAAVEGWLDSSTTAVATKSYQRITAAGALTATAVHTVAATPAPDRIHAVITNGATPGNVTLQAASVTAGQTTTIFAGASFRTRKLAAV